MATEKGLLQLPTEIIGTIFSYQSYNAISNNRLTCRAFNKIGQQLLNQGFIKCDKLHAVIQKEVKAKLPRRESERRTHKLARHIDILAAVETRLSLLSMTYSKYIDKGLSCFVPGKVLDEICHILGRVRRDPSPPRAHELLTELRDISSMAMEHFDEKIAPSLKAKLNPVSLELQGACLSSLASFSSGFGDNLPLISSVGSSVRRPDLALIRHGQRSTSASLASIRRGLSGCKASMSEQCKRVGEQDKQISDVYKVVSEMKKKLSDQECVIRDLSQRVVEMEQRLANAASPPAYGCVGDAPFCVCRPCVAPRASPSGPSSQLDRCLTVSPRASQESEAESSTLAGPMFTDTRTSGVAPCKRKLKKLSADSQQEQWDNDDCDVDKAKRPRNYDSTNTTWQETP